MACTLAFRRTKTDTSGHRPPPRRRTVLQYQGHLPGHTGTPIGRWRDQGSRRGGGGDKAGLVGVEFNAPLDTVKVISEAVFTANHLTDTDKLETVQENTDKQTRYESEKVDSLKYSETNKTTLVQLPLTTLGQETRWAYSTPPPSPHGAADKAARNESVPIQLAQCRLLGLAVSDAKILVYFSLTK